MSACAARRGCRLVVLAGAGTGEADVDGALRAGGLQPADGGLVPVDRGRAETIVRTMLRFGLAYHEELLPGPAASEAAATFVEMVGGDDARFLTNRLMDGVSEDRPLGEGWNPVSDATFDAVVVAVGAGVVGLIAVRDED